MRHALVPVCLGLAVATAFSALGATSSPLGSDDEPVAQAVPSPTVPGTGLYRFDDGRYVFEYHAPTGTEYLFDRAEDPSLWRNVVTSEPDVARRLRTALLRDLGVESLDALRAPYRANIERLRGLGYM